MAAENLTGRNSIVPQLESVHLGALGLLLPLVIIIICGTRPQGLYVLRPVRPCQKVWLTSRGTRFFLILSNVLVE